MGGRQTTVGGRRRWVGPLFALWAALAFALSVPVSKALLRDTPQLAVAGLLYLGAGLTLSAYRLLSRVRGSAGAARGDGHGGGGTIPVAGGRRRPTADWAWLGAATISGAVLAPLFLLWGLKATPAATASLLLAFETVFTALWAAGLFKEHVSLQVWGAVVAVTVGGVVLGSRGGRGLGGLARGSGRGRRLRLLGLG